MQDRAQRLEPCRRLERQVDEARARYLDLFDQGIGAQAIADRIGELACNPSLEQAASELIRAARLPSGALQDDIAVIIAG